MVRDLSNAEVLRRVWELYSVGRMRDIFELLDPDVEWRPMLPDAGIYRGHAGLARWARSTRRAWKSVTIVYEDLQEVAADCVLGFGRITAFDHRDAQVLDSPIACVAELREGRIVRACAFLDHESALAWVSARPALP
jgi:ketosteroid isomerase-like protein